MNKTIQDLILERAEFSFGTTVTNCVAHMSIPLTECPDDCRSFRTEGER